MTLRSVSHLVALLLSVTTLAGCTLEEAKTAPSPAAPIAPVVESAPPVAPPPAVIAPEATGAPAVPSAPAEQAKPGSVSVPPMMAQGDPNAPLTKTPELDKAIADVEKGMDKKATAGAYAARGTFRMNDSAAGAKVKYRAALDDYRKALSLDPANSEAKANKGMIESIYKSMGRPIPGE